MHLGWCQQARWRGCVGGAIQCQWSGGASLLRVWNPHERRIAADTLRYGAEGMSRRALSLPPPPPSPISKWGRRCMTFPVAMQCQWGAESVLYFRVSGPAEWRWRADCRAVPVCADSYHSGGGPTITTSTTSTDPTSSFVSFYQCHSPCRGIWRGQARPCAAVDGSWSSCTDDGAAARIQLRGARCGGHSGCLVAALCMGAGERAADKRADRADPPHHRLQGDVVADLEQVLAGRDADTPLYRGHLSN